MEIHGSTGSEVLEVRVDPELSYQDYKDGVDECFWRLGCNENWEKAENITDWMADEDDDLLITGSTSLALWIISIGEYEVRHDILEERVLAQLSYHIPQFQAGTYTEDLTEEEYEQVKKDVEYILSKVKLYDKVEEISDEEYERIYRNNK